MLLSESELNMYNAESILDEAVLLDESDSALYIFNSDSLSNIYYFSFYISHIFLYY